MAGVDGFDVVLLLNDQRVLAGIAIGALVVLILVSSVLGGKKNEVVDPEKIAREIIGQEEKAMKKKSNSKSKSKSKKKKSKAAATVSKPKPTAEPETKEEPVSAPAPAKNGKSTKTNGSKEKAPVEEEAPEPAPTTKAGKKKKKKKKKKDQSDATENKENEKQQQQGNKKVAVPVDDEDSDEEDEFDQAARLLGLQKKKTTNVSLTHTVISKKTVEEKNEPKSSDKGGNKSAKAKEEPSVDPNIIIGIGSDPALIIGPGGSIIQNIESTSGAKLDILKHTPEPNKNSVRITASSEQSVTVALEMVQAIVDAEEKRLANLKSVTLGPNDIKGSDGVKAIIGRGGQTIKDIQQKCGEGLKIDANVEQGTVTVSGPKQKVDEAVVLCKVAVFGEAQDTIDLKTRAGVNIVFGKDFGTIRDIQNTSGAKLDIEKGSTVLKFSGKKEAVDQAKSAVTDLLKKFGGVTMTIKSSDIGAVYGKSGANIRSIQDRTGAYIDVDQPKGSASAICNIMGEPSAVEEAKKLVQKAIDGEIEVKAGEILETLELGVATPAVIGRAGTRVKELEKAHGVRINVNSESGICRIVGKDNAVKSAKKAIEVIMQPLLMEEAAKKEAEKNVQAGDSTWAVTADDELDGW